MHERALRVFAEELAHPGHALSPDDVVSVNRPLQPRNRRHVATDHNRRPWRVLAHQAAHFPDLADIHDNRRDADDVVVVRRQFLDEAFAGRKVEQRRKSEMFW